MYLIGKKLCPSCGVRGNAWKKDPEVLFCPSCKTFFNEFGVVLETAAEKEEVVT